MAQIFFHGNGVCVQSSLYRETLSPMAWYLYAAHPRLLGFKAPFCFSFLITLLEIGMAVLAGICEKDISLVVAVRGSQGVAIVWVSSAIHWSFVTRPLQAISPPPPNTHR